MSCKRRLPLKRLARSAGGIFPQQKSIKPKRQTFFFPRGTMFGRFRENTAAAQQLARGRERRRCHLSTSRIALSKNTFCPLSHSGRARRTGIRCFIASSSKSADTGRHSVIILSGARVPWEDGARLSTQGLPLFEQSPPFKIQDTANVGLIRVQGGQSLKTVVRLLIPPMCKCAYTVHPSICPCLLEYSDNITNAEKSVKMC